MSFRDTFALTWTKDCNNNQYQYDSIGTFYMDYISSLVIHL